MLWLWLAALLPCTAAGPDRPNVLFVLADDWGWGDVGSLARLVNGGDKTPVTPALDRMAAEGTVYARFHTLASVCSPSRASWMTGRYPLDVGSPYIYQCAHAANAKLGQWDFVPSNSSFIARELKAAGYRTAHYGKWHLGCTPDAPSVNSYGFDDSVTYVSNVANSRQWENASDPTQPFDDPWFPANSSRLIVDHTLAFAALEPAKPFYINVWLHISHAPLNPTPEQLVNFSVTKYCPWSGAYSEQNGKDAFSKCPIQIFRASQHEADRQIGRLLDTVRSKYPNTMVLFSGDNGPEDPHIYFNSVGSAGAFRGRKRSLYEGGISTPLIVWWPGMIAAGVVSEADIASIDFFPTVMAITKLTPVSGVAQQLRGRDASKILLHQDEKAAPPRTSPLVWDYRMSMPGKCYHQSPRLAILEQPMKLLMHPDRSRLELYNVSADLYEQNDLSQQHPGLVEVMSEKLLAWVAAMPKTPPENVFLNPGCLAHRSFGGFGGDKEEQVDVDARFREETAGLSPYELA